MGPVHAIHGLTCAPGRLEFDVRIGERTERLWFHGGELTPTPDAALIAGLMPAMAEGGTLEVPYLVSPRLLRNQREYQAVQAAWSLDWDFGFMPLRLVDVHAPARAGGVEGPKGRVAAFFSGGVDSWMAMLENPDVSDLVFIRGFDSMLDAPHQADLVGEVEERLRSAAAELERTFHVVESNLRRLSDPLLAWESYLGAANVAVAHFLAPHFDRVHIANDSDYEVQERFGISGLVHQALSSESLEIAEAGGRHSRLARVRRVGAHRVARKSLRVCWENRDSAYNCGHCPKCLLTMCELEVTGFRGKVETFPSKLSLDALGEIEIQRRIHLTFWEDVLDGAKVVGQTSLANAAEDVVRRGKRNLGLPPSYRRRRRPPRAVLAAREKEAERGAASRGWYPFRLRGGSRSETTDA